MEHAKKLVLIEENVLDSMLRRKDLSWKRPTDETIKGHLSREMRTELDDASVPKDLKAKRHRQLLSRFLNTKREVNVVKKKTTPARRLSKAVRWETW